MKKNYTRIKVFAVAFAMTVGIMSAQLGGVYTINSASPTAGSNFQSFNAFRTALLLGVSGGVTVNVVANSGPYVEQVDFPQIAGTSALNPVIINGNGNTLSFNSSNNLQPHTLAMSGGDFFTFNDLIIEGTGTYAFVVHIWNDSDNNTFESCEMNAPVNGTSTNHIPYSLSGSGSSYSSAGNTGDNNLANNCIMRWGYFGVTMYGLTGSPYNTNNRVENSSIRDWYGYGAYIYYQRQMALRGNTIHRPNRATLTTTYGIYTISGTIQAYIENNRIQELFEGNPGYSATVYGIRIGVSSLSGQEHQIVNNLIKIDKKGTGTVYGMYVSNVSYANVYHNTIVCDEQNIAASYTYYGVYGYGTNLLFRNNNISVTDIGTGTRYGLYFNSTWGNGNSNGNNIYINAPSATNYVGYYIGTLASNLAAWQVVNGFDANSFSTDPLFLNPNGNDYMPASYVMNNGGLALGVANDINGASRSMATPDPGAFEYFNTPCSGSPALATAITPTIVICPNSPVNMYLSPSYTTSGITYQWQSSTVSPVGPWVAAGTGTNASFNTTVGSVPIYYSAIVTCTNGGNNITAVAGSVNVAATTTNSVPYFEGFEGIAGPGKLPNCSWTASNMNSTCFTYTAPQNQSRVACEGSKFASFYYSPVADNFFWSNGIWMEAGVTYSINIYYLTEYYTDPTWQLNLWVGPNQSTVNANVVASSGGSGSAASPACKLLSNTYTVATTGFYHVGINGKSNGTCCGYYLSWDALEITAPCNLNPFPLVVNSNAQTICAGQSVNLTASGASSYAWSNGATTNVINVSPSVPTNYVVVGTNAASGCTAAVSQYINVNPAPPVGIFAPNSSVCLGSSVILTAFGANTFAWSNGATSNIITVSPTANTTYTVIGSNAFGCTGQMVQAITVNTPPSVNIISAALGDLACMEDFTELSYSGNGGVSFQWYSVNGAVNGNPVNVNPQMTTTYTLVATSAQGCTNQATYDLYVTECVGLQQNTASVNGIKVFPNPNNGVFSIEWANGQAKSATVSDVSGRVVYTANSELNVLNIDLTGFSNGVYFVKVKSNGVSEIIQVVKQ